MEVVCLVVLEGMEAEATEVARPAAKAAERAAAKLAVVKVEAAVEREGVGVAKAEDSDQVAAVAPLGLVDCLVDRGDLEATVATAVARVVVAMVGAAMVGARAVEGRAVEGRVVVARAAVMVVARAVEAKVAAKVAEKAKAKWNPRRWAPETAPLRTDSRDEAPWSPLASLGSDPRRGLASCQGGRDLSAPLKMRSDDASTSSSDAVWSSSFENAK